MFKSVQLSSDPYPDFMVVGAFSDQGVSAALDHTVQEAAKRKSFTGEVGVLVEAYPSDGPGVVVVGLGKRAEFSAAKFRRAMGAVVRRLAELKAENVVIDFSGMVESRACGQIAGEACGLLAWRLRTFLGSGAKPDEAVDLLVSSPDEEFSRGLADGLKLAVSANVSRTLSATPPNVATPDFMAEQAQAVAKETGLACRIIRGDELDKERLTGLVNVGKASVNKPCLIRLEYKPSQVDGSKPVVLVGKTITYDTGGLTLKVNNGMVGMKGDKSGGCAVLGAMHAVATVIKPSFPVVALLVAAENMVSAESYRPDDVLTYRNGVTVEVTNTDAEGRLVLADGLCWACDGENPAEIIDMATLTGGVVTALGSTFAGLFATDDRLAEQLTAAGAETGERVWRLPLDEEYSEMMKSEVADLVNSNPNRKAHPIQGAAFLEKFVANDVPWAHIDIAGVAKADKDSACLGVGPTGFGVRLIANYLQNRRTS